MSDRVVLATFEHEDDLLAATEAVRDGGFRIVDAFTPYAVHGLERAMGLRPSRLTWVCFICGMIGALGMLWFEHWTASIAWQLDVGGKPWNSLPSDVPVAFEASVLLAGFGSVFALFAVSRLFPGKQPRIVHPRATDDRFVLVIEETDAAFDLAFVKQLLQEYHVLDVEERLVVSGGVS
jgi:Alternative complex III, ActD subunit